MNAVTDIKASHATIAMAYIVRFPKYAFSSEGAVISYCKISPRVLKPIKMGQYVGLTLVRDDGQQERGYLHRLIAEAFHGPCPSGMVCCHKDGDKTNNAAANLRWGTQSSNNMDKNSHGTAPHGEKNPMSKLTASQVAEMRKARALSDKSYAQIAEDFGVSTMTAFRVITKQSWSAT